MLARTGAARTGQRVSTSLEPTSVCAQTHSLGCTVHYEQTTALMRTALVFVEMVSVSIRAGTGVATSASVMRLVFVIVN